MSTYRKSRAFAPQGFFECEGRGLQWLGAAHAQGGPRVVQVYDWGKDYLDIERVNSSSPTAKAALEFGAALARMHDAGAEYFGSAPEGYDGTCYFGPLQDPVKMDTGEWTDPISYFADGRLRPMVELGVKRGELDQRDVDLTEKVIEALPDIMGRAAEEHTMAGNGVELPERDAILPSSLQRMHRLIALGNLRQITHTEQVQHGQILFTVTTMCRSLLK